MFQIQETEGSTSMARDRRRTVTAPSANSALTLLPDDMLVAADTALLRAWLQALRGGWRPKLRSPDTIRVYGHAVRSLLTFLRERRMPGLVDVSREHLLEWTIELRGTAAPATVRLYLVAVKLFYAWLVDEGERRNDPTIRLAGPPSDDSLVQPFTPDEIQALLETQNPKRLVGARNVALFTVLLDTALRREECAGIKLADVDWRHSTIRVMGKGRKERLVRIGTVAQRALAAYLRVRAQDKRLTNEWLWVSQGGGKLSGSAIEGICRQAGKVAGIHCHPHRFRHTSLQWLLDGGADRETARVLAGHSSYQTLQRYTRATDTRRALEQHERFSPADQLRRGRRKQE